MKRITIEDVAKAAGVSRQTVSRAMNDKTEISPVTKARVMEAIDELGYTPNRIAQAMVTRSSHTIGLIIGDITNPFFAEVARGVQDLAQQHDYYVIIHNTDDDPEGELRALRSLTAQSVDGIIGFLYNISDEKLATFADPNRPLVMINRVFGHPDIGALIVDNRYGSELAVEHLLAQGHTKIGMLTHINHRLDQVRRVQGYRDALRSANVQSLDRWIARGHPTLEGGYRAAMQLLETSPELTALFAYNDLMALGAIRAARELGRAIPADLSIIGYDDIAFAELTNPTLTSVRVNKYEIGMQAMQRFLAMWDSAVSASNPNGVNRQLEEQPSIPIELILRESA